MLLRSDFGSSDIPWTMTKDRNGSIQIDEKLSLSRVKADCVLAMIEDSQLNAYARQHPRTGTLHRKDFQ